LRCIDYAITSVVKEVNSAFILKDKQRTTIKSFVDRKDVFAKSLFYQLALTVSKKMGRNENPVVVVVSHLVALMEDQVKEATLTILLLLHVVKFS